MTYLSAMKPLSLQSIVFWTIVQCFVRNVYSRCVNWCSQRGICTSPSEGGYCQCDMGFTGEDCSQYLCPKAFDPSTLSERQSRRTIRMLIGNNGGVIGGQIDFSFGPSTIRINDVNSNELTSEECTKYFGKLKGVSSITCERTEYNSSTGTGSYVLTLNEYPLQPYENNLFRHDGNPFFHHFKCNGTLMDYEDSIDPYCEIEDIDTGPLPEYAECSNHGVCDTSTGSCICDHGYKGRACNDTRDNQDIVSHDHDGPFFTASIMALHARRKDGKEFNLFQARMNHQNITTIRGDRLLDHRGPLYVQDFLALGEFKESDRIDSKLYIGSKDEKNYLISAHDEAKNRSLMTLNRLGDVEILGKVKIGDDSHINGTLTAKALQIDSDCSIGGSLSAQALQIDTMTMSSTGISITQTNYEEKRPHSLQLIASNLPQRGSVIEIQSTTSKGSLIRASSEGVLAFDLSSDGLATMQGLKLQSGGINISSGGLSIQSGGARVNGGLFIESGGLHLTSEESFYAGRYIANSASPSQPLIALQSTASLYSGSLIDISMASMSQDHSILRVQSTSPSKDKSQASSLLSIKGDGSIHTQGQIVIEKDLSVDGMARMNGLSIHPKTVSAGTKIHIEIPSNVSYLIISPRNEDNKQITEIVVDINSPDVSKHIGHVLIISNKDQEDVIGDVKIPRSTLAMFVFDGVKYFDIQALKAPIQELSGIKSFEASADLNLGGNYSFTAYQLHSSRLTRGRVVFAGGSGAIIDSDKLTYQKGVLSTPMLKAEALAGDVDGKGHKLSNVRMESSWISATSIQIPSFKGSSKRNAYFDVDGNIQAAADDLLSFSDLMGIFTNESESKSKNHPMIHHLTAIISEKVVSDVLQSFDKPRSMQSKDIHADKIQANEVHSNNIYLIHENKESSGAQESSLLVMQSGSKPLSVVSRDIISIDTSYELVNIPRLGDVHLYGDVHGHGSTIHDCSIQGGRLQGIASVSSRSLQVDSLIHRESSQKRLVMSDEHGSLVSMASNESIDLSEASLVIGSIYLHDKDQTASSKDSLSTCEDISLLGHSCDGKIIAKPSHGWISHLTTHRLDAQELHISQAIYLSSSNEAIESIPITDRSILIRSIQTGQILEKPMTELIDEVKASLKDHINDHIADHMNYRIHPTRMNEIKTMISNEIYLELYQRLHEEIALNISSDRGLQIHDNISSIPSLNVTHDLYAGDIYLRTSDKMYDDTQGHLSKDLIALLVSRDGKIEEASTRLNRVIQVNHIEILGNLTTNGNLNARNLQLQDANHVCVLEDELCRVGYNATSQSIQLIPQDDKTVFDINRKDGRISTKQGHFDVVHAMDLNVSNVLNDINLSSNKLFNGMIANASILANTLAISHVDEISHGDVLIRDKDGRIGITEAVAIDKNQNLQVKGIVGMDGPIQMGHVTMDQAIVRNGEIANTKLSQISSLEVMGDSDLLGHVFIDGSVTVRGSVLGSGPYIDSSDRRLKKDIHPLLDNTLDQVMKLQGVHYNHRAEEYPSRQLSPRPQVGWIADDVMNIFPELVDEDAEGMKGISYSRAVVYLTKALQEMQQSYEQRISRLENLIDTKCDCIK